MDHNSNSPVPATWPAAAKSAVLAALSVLRAAFTVEVARRLDGDMPVSRDIAEIARLQAENANLKAACVWPAPSARARRAGAKAPGAEAQVATEQPAAQRPAFGCAAPQAEVNGRPPFGVKPTSSCPTSEEDGICPCSG